MKVLTMLFVAAFVMGSASTGFCGSNPVAVGTENVTKAPINGAKEVTGYIFQKVSPMKDSLNAVYDVVNDQARAAVVSVALNAGQPIEE